MAEGRLIRRQGAGTFVAEPKITWPLQLTSFTEQAAAVGFRAGAQLLSASRMRAEQDVADRLWLAPSAPVYRLERLRLADDRPMALEISYLSALRFPGLLGRVRRSSSLYRLLTERYQVEPADAEETIETAPATPRQAELLDTDTGAPMLVLSRHSFDRDGDAGGVGAQLVSRRPLHLRRPADRTCRRAGRLSMAPAAHRLAAGAARVLLEA